MEFWDIPRFEDFVSGIFSILGHLKVWRKNDISRVRRMFDLLLVAYLMFFNVLLIVSEFLDAGNYYDLSSFAAHINPLFLHCLGLFKWSYCILHHGEIVELVKCMENCHNLCKRINLQDIEYQKYKLKLFRCQKNSTLFMNVWFFVAIGGVMQWCTNPVMYDFYEQYYGGKIIQSSAMRRLPYPGLFPWEINSISRYIMSFAFQLWGGIGSTVGVAVFDILNLTFMMYICVQLDYLKDTLLDKNKEQNYICNKIQIYELEEKLKNCIRHHDKILIFLTKLEKFSTGPMFVQCVGTIIALCLISFEASTIQFNGSIEPIMKTIMMFEYWSSIVAELFLYCYIASKIGDLGTDVGQAIYASNWEQSYVEYSVDNKSKRKISAITNIIQFSIMRAQRPILITGGGFYILCLPTFKALVGLSVSNALILRQLQEDG
ncbi:odorant receptor 13a-like [Diachasma alloeum]|uniref:odorant receptor 13a-like n=1 Tax=Diachasma alloeum TaxID=454923 RepID=UPI0007384762|nr:odorant receptor 13a-like [Diachasma alloeum]